MATSKRQISNSPNRNAVKQTHNEPRVKIWILLALLAMLTFGSSMFFYSRLANLDMAKKDLERPLIIQSAPAVASFAALVQTNLQTLQVRNRPISPLTP